MSEIPRNDETTPVRDEKLAETDIVFVDPKMKKLENFFYYHKWKLLAAVLVFVVVAVCVLQACQTVKYDSFVMYAGPYMITAHDATNMTSAFSKLLDHDEEGEERQVQLVTANVMSAEQIVSLEAVTDEDGNKVYSVNREFNHSELERFDSLILAGEYSVCLLDPYLYERVCSSGGFRQLDEVLGYKPECAIDDYGISLKDTEFAKAHPFFGALPEDTVLCLRTKAVIGFSAEAYALSEQLFKAIVEYIPN